MVIHGPETVGVEGLEDLSSRASFFLMMPARILSMISFLAGGGGDGGLHFHQKVNHQKVKTCSL